MPNYPISGGLNWYSTLQLLIDETEISYYESPGAENQKISLSLSSSADSCSGDVTMARLYIQLTTVFGISQIENVK